MIDRWAREMGGCHTACENPVGGGPDPGAGDGGEEEDGRKKPPKEEPI